MDKPVKNEFRKYYWWTAEIVDFGSVTLFATCKLSLELLWKSWHHHVFKWYKFIFENQNLKALLSTVNTELSLSVFVYDKLSPKTGKFFSLFHKSSKTDNLPLTLPTLKRNDNVFERVQSL